MALTIAISIAVQQRLSATEAYVYLFLYYSVQFLLILSSSFFFRRRKLDRSYILYILLLFSFFTCLSIFDFPVYLWMFLAVLTASLIFRVRRTAIVYFLLTANAAFSEKSSIMGILDGTSNFSPWNSIPFFTLTASLLTGFIISLIIYSLERSFHHLYSLEKTLESKKSILTREKEAARQYRHALMGNELKFKTIIEYAFDGIAILDREGNHKFVSNSTSRITGFSSGGESGAIDFERIHPDDKRRVVENFRNISDKRIETCTIYYRYMHRDGNWRNLEVTVTNLLDNPGIEGILFVYRDVTKHMRAEQRARYLEYYDQLTGLPNQLMFSDKVREEIERSAARRRSFAVMCLGINSFKDINGQYGTTFGDIVLKQIGSRLKSHFRGDDFVSRMMGDKFLILFSDMNSDSDVIAIVQKTMNIFETPFWIDNRDITISVCIGISVYPNDSEKMDELIKNCETALFICKENRERRYTLFNKNQNRDIINRIQIEKEIYKAIENKSFTVYFQPKMDLFGNVSGAEALIRWFNAERGMMPPGQFIPISERNRSIIDIGKIVMEKSFRQLREWMDSGLEPVRISINVAPMQFSHEDFIQSVEELQNLYSLDPSLVEFEITETGIMENEKKTVEIMESLILRGYSISIDDFGTGYSSLNKLKDYPVSTLKIDKSFIDPIPEDVPSCNIVRTIIDLAHFLNYKVVAEGVETREQLDLLLAYGCDLIQGYYYYKPMPSAQFVKLLKKPAS